MTVPTNKISPDLLFTASEALRRTATPRPSLAARVKARLRAYQLDRQLAVGVPARAGSALAVHQARLVTVAEREAIALTLRQALQDANAGAAPLSSRIPLHPTNVVAAQDVIDAITLRLSSPRPVSARGMARLRVVLSDGAGPMYRLGRGDLSGRLGAALAEL
jgi:alpha-beta hydrolase superfamily lysophospholipase